MNQPDHRHRLDMIDSHVYVYNNVHRHLNVALSLLDVDVGLVLDLMMNVNDHVD